MATGHKTGGRKKGTPNKKTADIQAAAAATGEMPLDYMLRVMRDEQGDKVRRDDMAKAAAPYLHPKLSAVEHSGKGGTPLVPVLNVTIARDQPTATPEAGRGPGKPGN